MPPLGADESLRQPPDPNACFLCGAPVTSEEDRTREHVFPTWMQNYFKLWDQMLTLKNGSAIPYRQLTIPCCADCNGRVLNPLESEISTAFRRGPDAVRQVHRERLFLWLAKFLYGVLFRELSLLADRSASTLGTITTPEMLKEFGIHRLLLRRLLGEVQWSTFPASIFIYEALEGDDPRLNFDYFDVLNQPFLTMRCGRTFVVVFLQDFGAVAAAGVDDWQLPTAARQIRLHPLQCTELTAMYITVLLDHHPPRLLIAETDYGWHVLAIDRGDALDVDAVFDDWDPLMHEWALRGVFKTQLGTDIVHTGQGIPSVILDGDGEPFQAPSFDWQLPVPDDG
jgi:hypothetical protein